LKSISINTPSVWPSISVQLQWTFQPTRKWYIKKNKTDSACTSLYSRLFYCTRQFMCYIKLKPQHTCPNCIHQSVHRAKQMVVLIASMWIPIISYRYSNIVTTDWLVGSLHIWYYVEGLHLFKKIYKLFMESSATDTIDYVDRNLIYKNIMTVYSGNNSIPTFTLVLFSDSKLFHYHYTMNVKKNSFNRHDQPNNLCFIATGEQMQYFNIRLHVTEWTFTALPISIKYVPQY